MPEFDFRAAIKELAEMEWSCPCSCHSGYFEAGGHRYAPPLHLTSCLDTCLGHIVPFAALRTTQHNIGPSCLAGCRGWVPEPDVRVACWEIVKVLADSIDNDPEAALHLIDNLTDDGVFRVALAWVEEQHD